ncbi:hypothetical protein B0T09DRAFT_412551 [Sordaria sp. MPI-SDFR-AT-0083]|nr:hypothetical protein B0T09DRAFT_412551 [Sordaria sp. MPI-SDFR-AT-0083]
MDFNISINSLDTSNYLVTVNHTTGAVTITGNVTVTIAPTTPPPDNKQQQQQPDQAAAQADQPGPAEQAYKKQGVVSQR